MAITARSIVPDKDLASLDSAGLHEAVIGVRNDIRWHRDQRGHDRCWLDDLKVYSNLPEYKNPYELHMCQRAEFLERCEDFFENRQLPNESVTAKEARRTPPKDTDLDPMSAAQLRAELIRLRAGIREHRKSGRTINWEGDQLLYAMLPDTTRAITALPPRERFLRGCRRFSATRGDPPKLHEW